MDLDYAVASATIEQGLRPQVRPVLPPDWLEYPDYVRLGEEGRFTRRGRDSQEDGPVDKDKSMTEAWTTWGLQTNATTPRSCTTSST